MAGLLRQSPRLEMYLVFEIFGDLYWAFFLKILIFDVIEITSTSLERSLNAEARDVLFVTI